MMACAGEGEDGAGGVLIVRSVEADASEAPSGENLHALTGPCAFVAYTCT